MNQGAAEALPLKGSLRKLEESSKKAGGAQRKRVKIQAGYSLCDLRRKARMDGLIQEMLVKPAGRRCCWSQLGDNYSILS